MISSAPQSPAPREIPYPRDGRFVMRLLIIEDDRDAADYLAKAFREELALYKAEMSRHKAA